MALIIEDGSIVTGANSFTTDVEFLAYAAARAVELPATEAARNALQVRAVDYLFSKEGSLKGCRINAVQGLPYPRRGVCVYGFNVAIDAIPAGLKSAQMELGMQSHTSELLISGISQDLESFSVDDVYTESYHSGGSWEHVRTDKADAYLNPLLDNNGSRNMMGRV